MDNLSTMAIALGGSWASGINLYATVLTLGVLQRTGLATLPQGLESLDNWWVIGIAGGLYLIEFVADKVPYVDSIWDVVHTFIRVPAAAVMAYSATAEIDGRVASVAMLLGGGVALTSHGTKAGVRMLANLSPEPFSNWALSIIEDILAFFGIVLAIFAPIILFAMLVIFFALVIFLGPKVVRAVKKLFRGAVALIRGKGWKTAAKIAD